MSPEELLARLEGLGTIDTKVLRKIRQQIDDHNQGSSKPLKPEAILKYLVQKNHIDSSQAQLLAQPPSTSSSSAPSSSAPSQPQYEIDDLIAIDDPVASEPKVEPKAEPPKAEPPKAEPPKAEPKAKLPKSEAVQSGTSKTTSSKVDPAPKKEKPASPVTSQVPSNEEKPSKPKEANRPRVRDKIARAETILDTEMLVEANYEASDNDAFNRYTEPEEVKKILPTFRGKLDKRNQWATKWLYIATISIALLLIFGAVLYVATIGVNAEDKFKFAKQSLERLAYQDAAKKFEEYYKAHPTHKYVPDAKAYRAQALIANHYQGKLYADAIRTAEAVLPEITHDKSSKIDLIRDDLAFMLPTALFEVTESAKKAFKLEDLRKELDTTLNLKKVIDNVEYIPETNRRKTSTAENLQRIDNNIRILQGQIQKEEEYQKAIVEIAGFAAELKTNEAFAVYRRLTRNFGDLAAREELRKAIVEVSQKEQQLVKPLSQTFPVAAQPRLTPIAHSYVLMRPSGETVDHLKDEIIPFLADGSVYGIRGSDGVIVWRRFVGYQTEIQPQWTTQHQLLIADQQESDLLLVDSTTGHLIWRTEIGEPFLTPAINNVMVVVTTKSGKVLVVNPESGQVERAAQLPQPADVPAMVADREPYIYQLGTYSNLYVLSKEDLQCREVYFLGHEKGSIAVPPLYWGGYIAIGVNRGEGCDLWIFKPDPSGLNLNLVQVINKVTDGTVSYPIQRYSTWILISSDNGDVRVMEQLVAEDDQPLEQPIAEYARDRFENEGAKTFLVTEGNNIWIGGLGISRVKFQRTQAKLSRETIANPGDLFLSPLTQFDDYIVHVRRRKGSGVISAALVDSTRLEQVWRTDFGGLVPGEPLLEDDSVMAYSSQGDLFRVYLDSTPILAPAAVSSRTLPSLKFDQTAQFEDGSTAAIGIPGQRELMVSYSDQSALINLVPPADKPASKVLVAGNHLIFPSLDGPIVRVDPKTGRMVGTPFMPPIAAGLKTHWLPPVWVDANRIVAANGEGGGSASKLYLLSCENESQISEVKSFSPPAPLKSAIATDGKVVFGAIASGGVDQLISVSIDTFDMAGKVDLPGHVIAGPWLAGQTLLVKLDNDQLLAWDTSLQPLWSLSVPNERFAGAPILEDNQLMVSFQNGQIWVIDPSNGNVSQSYDLRQPIAGTPVRVGRMMMCNGLDGTVHYIDWSRTEGAN